MMTIKEQKLAIAQKLPELIVVAKQSAICAWKINLREINWPTEGLQVCHEAEKLLTDGEWEIYCDILANSVCVSKLCFPDTNRYVINATYEQRLEALCRVWWPERWKD